MGRRSAKKGGDGSGGGSSGVLLTGGTAAALAVLYMAYSGFGRDGCMDASAINFSPLATVDDGSCVGSMYDLEGVFEYQHTAGAAERQLEAIGIEFDAHQAQQMVLITKVIPGSVASESGTRAGDELLALKVTSQVTGKTDTVLISARGRTGVIDAVRRVMATPPGARLAWVLRHASANGGIEDIDLTFEASTIEVMPPLDMWVEQQEVEAAEWADRKARQVALSAREDLRWCRSTTIRESVNGWYTLAILGDIEQRIIRVPVGFNNGHFDLAAAVTPTQRGYNRTEVTGVQAPKKLACCSFSMATSGSYEDIKVGDEILAIAGQRIARQGPDALADALQHARNMAKRGSRVIWVIRRVLPDAKGKHGEAKASTSKVEKALTLLAENQNQNTQLGLKDAQRAMDLMKRAIKHESSVSLAEWASFGSTMHQLGSSELLETGEGGFRPEIVRLAVPALAKALEMTLFMMRALNIDAVERGFFEQRDTMEEQMSGEAAHLRLSLSFTKLMSSLVWLNQTSAACALGDLAVAEAVYNRADQACGHCTRGIVATASVLSSDALGTYARLLERNFEAIKEEFVRVAHLAEQNPHAGAFFQQEKESLASDRQESWREVELFRRGYELKHCRLFPSTCGVARQLPEASKFAGSIKFSTMAPGANIRPHFALANDHLRLHLGVVVPEPDAVDLRIAGTRYGWEEGKVIGFDNSIVNSALHRGTLNHTVLVVDIVHPNHPDPAEVMRDTVTDEEFEAIQARQETVTLL